MYSNSGGRFLFKRGLAKRILKNMTESYGRKYSDPKSVKVLIAMSYLSRNSDRATLTGNQTLHANT